MARNSWIEFDNSHENRLTSDYFITRIVFYMHGLNQDKHFKFGTHTYIPSLLNPILLIFLVKHTVGDYNFKVSINKVTWLIEVMFPQHRVTVSYFSGSQLFTNLGNGNTEQHVTTLVLTVAVLYEKIHLPYLRRFMLCPNAMSTLLLPPSMLSKVRFLCHICSDVG